MFKNLFFLFFTLPLFANYQSTYIPDQVRKDFSEQNFAKYQRDSIPIVTLEELKKNAVFNAASTLERHVSGTPDFNTIVAANVCRVDNSAAYSSTIYEVDLPSGAITCMYAVKDDLYNPQGLFKVFVPEIKAYYRVDTDAAAAAKATEIAKAEAQFLPLLQKKQEIITQMEQNANASYLTIPELLTAAVLTDDEIIDIEATRATGKFQLKSGFSSKFTSGGGGIVDNSEYLLTDAATIFDVYAGLGSVSMTYLLIMVVGFGVYGGVRFFGGAVVDKVEKGGGSDKKTPFIVGIAAGVLLFFPTNQVSSADGTVADYELLKTRYQEFEKFGYYTFSDWAKASAKVIIDAEINALVRKSGLGTKDQIANIYAQVTQSERLNTFYTSGNSTCSNSIYTTDNLSDSDGKAIFSETDKGLFPSSESWAWASYLVRPLTNKYYKAGDGGLLHGGAAAGDYPKLAFSACGKISYAFAMNKKKKEDLEKSYENLVPTSSSAGGTKIDILGGIFQFQYQLFNDWGYLAVLGLPVTKMQTEYIGGLYKSGDSEVLEKMQRQNGTAGLNWGTIPHTIMSSIPYMFVPGAGTVFQVSMDAAKGVKEGFSDSLAGKASSLIGAGIVTSVAGTAAGLTIGYTVAKAVLALAPIVAILAIGLLRFIIIILKVFSFHFLSIFMMPIMFLKENVRGIATFSMKILATMLEIPVFVLAVWLAVTANSLIHTIGTVFSQKIIGGMLDNNDVGHEGVSAWSLDNFAGLGEMMGYLRIYLFDGFMEVLVAVFSIVIVYKIIITLHTSFFEMLDIQSSHAIDNSVEGMKNEAGGWGTRI